MKKGNWRHILVFAIGLFLLLSGRSAGAADKDAMLRERLLEGYRSYSKSVNVKELGLYVGSSGDEKILQRAMEEILNETVYLFYAGRDFKVSADAHTGRITGIRLSYDSRYLDGSTVNVSRIKKVRKKLDSKISSIMKSVKPGMSDVEKALLLHDYLARTVTYTDSASALSRISEEGALLQKKANCNGYALAYIALLEKAGIEAKCVASESMAHMWNLLQIGGKWYHVDLVWDAPLSVINGRNMYGYVCHDNFLLSNAAMKKTGHSGFSAPAASTKYDNKYWRSVDSSFWYQNGRFYYAGHRGIFVRKRLESGSARRLVKGEIQCFVKYQGYKFYGICGNRVYRFDVRSRKKREVYKAPKGSRLAQLKCSGKKLCFRLKKGKRLYTKVKRIR